MRSSLRIVIVFGVILAHFGGAMMTGGFSELAEADSDPDVGHMMNFIASEVKNSMFQGEACEISVDTIHKVERQVVAGMNYRATVSLKSTCVIPGGARESLVRCEAVRVFQPLPFRCDSSNPDNPKCMEVTEANVSEKCSSNRDLPTPPLPGGFSGGFSELAEAGSDPEVGHVMTFIASEVKNSMFQGEACEIAVDDVHKVERQVVAGMNYRVTVSLKSTCVIPGGARESVIRCEKVKVFKPLPFSCNSPNPDNPKCMELTEADMSEKCSSDRELPSPPLPGGFSELAEAGSDPDVGHVMNFIASEVKNSIFQGEACEIEVDSVHKVERQVVAGMNYRVTVSLKSTCVIPGGARESVLRCEAVKVFQPLPFSCNSPNPDNPKCMELTEADITEKCSSDRELPSPPPGGLPGGFSNAGEDPALTDVLDFAKLEAKNSLLQKYGSDNCDMELDNLGRVESQVVAGTNYRITFSLKSTCAIPGGSNEIAINCQEIVVYVPLEVFCKDPNPDNPKCMEMSERLEENCSVSLQ